MNASDALAQLMALQSDEKAAQMAAYHKVERPYLGVSNPEIDVLYKQWRGGAAIDGTSRTP